MKKIKRMSKKRLVLVLILACGLFFALTFRTGYLQIIKGDWLSTKAIDQQTREIPIEPKRGTIYDRNMKEIAVSITKYTVWCKPVEVKDKEAAAKQVAEILGKEYDDVYKSISKKNMALVKVQRWIDDEKASKIREAKISGIWVAEDNQRYYPYGNFAAYVLGHTSADSQGIAGVEMQYDKHLKGTAGKLIVSTDASGREIPQGLEKYYEPVQGNGLILTIDEVIQHYTEKAVQKAYELNNAKRVTVVAMDPKTGDILSMASKPDYDPNDSRTPIYPYYQEELDKYDEKDKIKGYYQMWRNPAVSDTYEPGSTFKLITSSAGIEEGVVKESDKFTCTGSLTIGGRRIKCWRHYRPHGEQTFAEGVQNSCNPVFMTVAERLGVAKMYDYIEAFGFMEKTGIDLPGEAKGIVYNEKNVGPVELATMSFGQRFTITPLQMITAACAIANDGVLVKPRLITKVENPDTGVVTTTDVEEVRQVISPETAARVRSMMQSVVTDGGGQSGAVKGYSIGGKTGTSEPNPNHPEDGYVASFLAIAPVENTKVVALMSLYGPQGRSHFGGEISAPVVSQVLSEVLPYLGIPSNDTSSESTGIKIPDLRNKTVDEAKQLLKDLGITCLTSASSSEIVTSQTPKAGTSISPNGVVRIYTAEHNSSVSTTVPDLKGKSLTQATSALKNRNLNIKATGSGTVVSQDLAVDSSVEEGTIVRVTLQKVTSDLH